MNVIVISGYGDFDMKQLRGVFIGEAQLPKFEKGMLKEEIVRELKLLGYKPAKITDLTFTDDHFCASEDEKKREDKRLRLS